MTSFGTLVSFVTCVDDPDPVEVEIVVQEPVLLVDLELDLSLESSSSGIFCSYSGGGLVLVLPWLEWLRLSGGRSDVESWPVRVLRSR